jgi:NADPH2:quinone reductase
VKAWVSERAGGPETLQLQERPVPEPGAGDVLVRVQAVGINFPDGLLLRDLYQIKPPRPLVPGSELCGVVEELGDGVTKFQRGDVVIGRCGWGAMAEYVVLQQERCLKIPASLPRAEAACFLFAYATAYHALHDAGQLRPDHRLLVLGASGGTGSAAVDIGRALGARVIAATSTLEKLKFALAHGATQGLVYAATLEVGDGQRALASELKSLLPHGADVVFDPVGGAYTEAALRSLARGGRHLVVGFTAGIPRVPLNLPLLKRAQIVGVDWRMFIQEEPAAHVRNVDALLALWEAGQIAPRVTERHPFADAPLAIARLESRQALGKVAVVLT